MIITHALLPVSYTHLDVYKRQVYCIHDGHLCKGDDVKWSLALTIALSLSVVMFPPECGLCVRLIPKFFDHDAFRQGKVTYTYSDWLFLALCVRFAFQYNAAVFPYREETSSGKKKGTVVHPYCVNKVNSCYLNRVTSKEISLSQTHLYTVYVCTRVCVFIFPQSSLGSCCF